MERSPERDLLPMARNLDIGVTAWSPLGGGVLSGKYSSEIQEQKRFDPNNPMTSGFVNERNLSIAKEVRNNSDGKKQDTITSRIKLVKT